MPGELLDSSALSRIGTQITLPQVSTSPQLQVRALDRLFDYYQHTASLAHARLARQTRPGPAPTASAAPAAAPALDHAGKALAWARVERENLLACLDHATRFGQRARVIALTAALAEPLRRD